VVPSGLCQADLFPPRRILRASGVASNARQAEDANGFEPSSRSTAALMQELQRDEEHYAAAPMSDEYTGNGGAAASSSYAAPRAGLVGSSPSPGPDLSAHSCSSPGSRCQWCVSLWVGLDGFFSSNGATGADGVGTGGAGSGVASPLKFPEELNGGGSAPRDTEHAVADAENTLSRRAAAGAAANAAIRDGGGNRAQIRLLPGNGFLVHHNGHTGGPGVVVLNGNEHAAENGEGAAASSSSGDTSDAATAAARAAEAAAAQAARAALVRARSAAQRDGLHLVSNSQGFEMLCSTSRTAFTAASAPAVGADGTAPPPTAWMAPHALRSGTALLPLLAHLRGQDCLLLRLRVEIEGQRQTSQPKQP